MTRWPPARSPPHLRALTPGDPTSPQRLKEYRAQIVAAVAAVLTRDVA